jgi:hypothetical protein
MDAIKQQFVEQTCTKRSAPCASYRAAAKNDKTCANCGHAPQCHKDEALRNGG